MKLKVFLTILFGIFFGIFSFCSAEKVSDLIEYTVQTGTFVKTGGDYPAKIYEFDSSEYGTYCFQLLSMDQNYYTNSSVPYYIAPSNNATLTSVTINNPSSFFDKYAFKSDQIGSIVCFPVNVPYLYVSNGRPGGNLNTAGFSGYYNLFRLTTLFDESVLPISSVDSNYCEDNNLCVGNNYCENSLNTCSQNLNVCNSNFQACLDGNYDYGSGKSNVYINDIFHLGASNIIMNIPDEIDWDYAYTSSGQNMNIDIVGYNQDYEYISDVISVQNYKPTSEDFTKLFTMFGSYGGLLIACLFVILVFYFIKKIFK